ncbi:MAG: AAA family ATPase [Myxococcales bacterium]
MSGQWAPAFPAYARRVATLHFVYGKPGAGKTRLARELAATVPGVLFCEDEWLLALADPITTLEQYVAASRRQRAVIGPMAARILSLGTSVVFDFAANTVPDRAWVRSIFEAAGADHLLHLLDVPDEECRRRVRERNTTKPPGLYFGDVSEEIVARVLPHIVPPNESERFRVRTYSAGV